MDELYKEYVISYFNQTLKMHGDRPEALRYSLKGQRLRYEALLDIDTDISRKKILDYGCGKGDFCQFLIDRNISVSYTGLDINENLISIAKRKFPEIEFRVFDIEKDLLKEDFDYIFLCAVFNLKIDGLDETIKNVLIKLFDHCRIALAFNALSAHDPNKGIELHYVYPEDMLEFAIRNLSPHVVLQQSSIPHDFVIFVNRKKLH